jgi:hypothetical protein
MTAIKPSLQWDEFLGIGTLYDVEPVPYDRSYWQHYRDMDKTPMSAALTKERVDLVCRYWAGPVVDVGIGGGAFLRGHPECTGMDINPDAIEYLQDCGALHVMDEDGVEVLTFWDSAEHMTLEAFAALLAHCRVWCFISMPIYEDYDDAVQSKHFKPGEHLSYFTHPGLVGFMRANGWSLVEYNDMETRLGRESIGSYAFMRVRS